MKLFAAISTFLAAQAVIAMPTSTFSDRDMLNTILENRNALPFNSETNEHYGKGNFC
jgi:hypothetical protein